MVDLITSLKKKQHPQYLLRSYHVPGTALSALHESTHLILPTWGELIY